MKGVWISILIVAFSSIAFGQQDTVKNKRSETWVKQFYNIDAAKKVAEVPTKDTAAKVVTSKPVVPETNMIKNQIPVQSLEKEQTTPQTTVQTQKAPVFNNPQPNLFTEKVTTPIPYQDTRLGSSSPLYDTYQKNDFGAGAITNNPMKLGSGSMIRPEVSVSNDASGRMNSPTYRDTRLGSSSPLYDTYKKNDNGQGAITTNPNKWGGGGASVITSTVINQAPVQRNTPTYRDTRLGSSSPLYNTYRKNEDGAGSVTTNPNKWGGGAVILPAEAQIPVIKDTTNRVNVASAQDTIKKN